MNRSNTNQRKRVLVCGAAAAVLASVIPSTSAFAVLSTSTSSSLSPCTTGPAHLSPTSLAASRRDIIRDLFVGSTSAAAGWVVGTSLPEEAHASYTAYTQREQDWEMRAKNGDIKISTARDLRAQLREIAPMNTEKAYMFCPNGASAAVTPMMENRCSDQLAMPSVYGRTADTVGNSIPGFSKSPLKGSSISVGSLSAETGGFPSY